MEDAKAAMPRIFDNIEQALLPALCETLAAGQRADFCVGYFNLRGWRHVAEYAESWRGGDGHCCRLLIGMQVAPSDELRRALSHAEQDDSLDNQSALKLKRRVAEDFRRQLTFGVPTNSDEASLRRLSAQLKAQKLVVKVYLPHSLHAKLYLVHRQDANNPMTGFVGSSNLTFAGLAEQGELNVDVLDHDACNKLAAWFEDRWNERWCLDISKDLARIIDESWAADRLVPPYHVYLKMAWHLAQEARAGLLEFRIPRVFGNQLFDFQVAAVKLAARHLNRRGGVLVGDVVGLGKSILATALAKLFEEDHHTETLIICPKNLVSMWEDYVHRYRLLARVLSLSKVQSTLPEIRRYRVVLIDESHNLRNREGKRWATIRDYITRNDSRCILLSATPYNKSYLDLAAQLGLFIKEDTDLGIRPERFIEHLGGEQNFALRHQCPVRSLAAFEKSPDPDDWRDLMRLYLVRRTRGFIMQNYAKSDARGRYLEFPDGSKSYFPERVPKSATFSSTGADDPYGRLYAGPVVNAIDGLVLPRYGLGNYIVPEPKHPPTPTQQKVLAGLSRAGTRLKGFCRINLFKRLESAGPAFLLSVERHVLRNYVVLHALENGLDIPIGPQSAELLDSSVSDADLDDRVSVGENAEDETADDPAVEATIRDGLRTEADFRARAKQVYESYAGELKRRFRWLPSGLFVRSLATDLVADAGALIRILRDCGWWDPARDAKLAELTRLISEQHADEKVLVFTQFADTALYLGRELKARGVERVEAVTGDSSEPTRLAWRFAPDANDKRRDIAAAEELRVLIATDVLSEGQNLQDCAIVVNYDLPWAIIRLIQRAGRVDRIGQRAERILCYSFLPAEGVERIIRLRQRVRNRLQQNAEVIGADERFFDDDREVELINDLYNEKSGVLDDEDDMEVDLASYAYQIWKNATDADPSLAAQIEGLPDVVYATKAHEPTPGAPRGVLVYTRTPQDNDALAWIDEEGNPVTLSQLAILKAAACRADTPALPRAERHHELTERAVAHLLEEEKSFGGTLGRRTGARYKTYERLKRYRAQIGEKRDLLYSDEHVRQVERALEDIYRYPLFQAATDTLNRQIKAGLEDHALAELVLSLRADGRLCITSEDDAPEEHRLICSMGLSAAPAA
jgi:hypothetical protein